MDAPGGCWRGSAVGGARRGRRPACRTAKPQPPHPPPPPPPPPTPSLRLYEMFMGPLRDTKVWNTRSVDGVHRFLARAWRLVAQGGVDHGAEPAPDQARLLHATIKRVTEDTAALRFNTAIAAMMEFVNGALKWPEPRPAGALRSFALLLAPYAPHLAEELWAELGGGEEGLAYEPWPVADESLLVADEATLPVQAGRAAGRSRMSTTAMGLVCHRHAPLVKSKPPLVKARPGRVTPHLRPTDAQPSL